MARYKNGINGPVSGKVGSVVASSWKGIDYVKGLSDPRGKQGTPGQVGARQIFATVSSWLRPLKLLINIGFQNCTEGMTPMNVAISLTLREAVKGLGADREIDFSRAVFSRGDLLISLIEGVTALVAGVLQVMWRDAPASAFCKDTDRATFVFYNPAKEQFVAFEHVALRADGEVVLQLPAEFSGDLVHCYQFYVSEQGDAVSSSQYLGQVLVG
ncbi:MAG: DUF6266 family protein [Bacteroidota bacterium]